jgi:polyisoprenoid-binding protein YceI
VPAARRFVVQPADSKLTLAVSEQFVNVALPRDVVMTTSAIAGQLLLGHDLSIGPDSRFTADLSTLRSDDSDRDDDVTETYLETEKYPNAEFTPREFRNLPRPAPTAGPIRGQLAGDLTLHGQTRPTVFEVDGTLDGGTFRGKARTEVAMTAFGIKIPTLASLLRVEDRVRTEIELVAVAR